MTTLSLPKILSSYLEFIPQKERYIESISYPLPSYLRVNTIKTTVEKVASYLKKQGITFEHIDKPGLQCFFKIQTEKSIGNLPEYHLGLIFPQALSSALPVIALDPKPGEFILDLCAAPGSKTGFIAQIMNDTGTIVANDRKISRLTALSANIKRLGITNTITTLHRGEHFPCDNKFDKILLDAPCSGSGKYRTDEKGRIKFQRQGKTNLPAIQKGLIVKAFDLLRPGGTLVYSTCTLAPEENEGIVCHLLKNRQAEITSWEPPLKYSYGLTKFKETNYDTKCKKCLRFYPHIINSVGFFVAKVVKPN